MGNRDRIMKLIVLVVIMGAIPLCCECRAVLNEDSPQSAEIFSLSHAFIHPFEYENKVNQLVTEKLFNDAFRTFFEDKILNQDHFANKDYLPISEGKINMPDRLAHKDFAHSLKGEIKPKDRYEFEDFIQMIQDKIQSTDQFSNGENPRRKHDNQHDDQFESRAFKDNLSELYFENENPDNINLVKRTLINNADIKTVEDKTHDQDHCANKDCPLISGEKINTPNDFLHKRLASFLKNDNKPQYKFEYKDFLQLIQDLMNSTDQFSNKDHSYSLKDENKPKDKFVYEEVRKIFQELLHSTNQFSNEVYLWNKYDYQDHDQIANRDKKVENKTQDQFEYQHFPQKHLADQFLNKDYPQYEYYYQDLDQFANRDYPHSLKDENKAQDQFEYQDFFQMMKNEIHSTNQLSNKYYSRHKYYYQDHDQFTNRDYPHFLKDKNNPPNQFKFQDFLQMMQDDIHSTDRFSNEDYPEHKYDSHDHNQFKSGAFTDDVFDAYFENENQDKNLFKRALINNAYIQSFVDKSSDQDHFANKGYPFISKEGIHEPDQFEKRNFPYYLKDKIKPKDKFQYQDFLQMMEDETHSTDHFSN